MPVALAPIIALTDSLLKERSNLGGQEWVAMVRGQMPKLYILDSDADGYKFEITEGPGYWALLLWLPPRTFLNRNPLATGLYEWTRFALYSMDPFTLFAQPDPLERGRASIWQPYREGRSLAWLQPRDTIIFERTESLYELTIKG